MTHMRVGRANGEDWLRLGEAAEALGVNSNTVRRWSDAGKLTCYRSPGGHRRYRRRDVDSLLQAEIASPATASSAPRRSGSPSNDAHPDQDLAPLIALARAAADGVGVDAYRLSVEGAREGCWVLAAPSGRADGRPTITTAEALPAAAAVLRTGQRMVIPDVAATSLLTLDEADAHRMEGDRAVLAVPLTIPAPLVGALELVERGEPRSFDGAGVALAEFMARQMSRIIGGGDPDVATPPRGTVAGDSLPSPFSSGGKTRGGDRRPAASRPEADLDADATHADVETLVNAAMNHLRELTGAATCTLYRAGSEMMAPFPAGGSPGALPIRDGAPWRLEEYPAAAEAVATGAPVVCGPEDTLEPSPRTVTHLLESRRLVGALLLPLVVHGQPVAVVELGMTDPDVLHAARSDAEFAADVVRATLGVDEVIADLQRKNRDLGAVIEASLEDASTLGGGGVLQAVVKRLSRLVPAPVTEVYAVEGESLRALMSYDGKRFDTEWEGMLLPLRRYPCSRRAVKTGEIVVTTGLDDALLDDEGRHSLEKWGYQSQLSMPLSSRGRVIGLIELSDHEPRDFTPYLELIHGLGQVASRALETASLLEQAERRSRILNELVELGALASRSRDLDAFLHGVAARLVVALDAANCDVFRDGTEGLRCVASYDRSGHDEAAIGTILDADSYPTVIAAMNAHRLLVVSSSDDPKLSERERRTYREYGFASEVSIPLVVNDRLYGMLDIYDTRERDFGEYLSFLRNAAQTVAGAVENAQLVEQLAHRSSVLRDIVELGAATSQAADLGEALAALAERTRDTIGAADCDIFTLQDDRLRCFVSANRDGFDASVVGRALDMERFPATELAVRSGRPMTISSLDDPRLTNEERASMGEHGYQSELCIPLMDGDRAIGLIDVFDTRPRDFGEYLGFLQSVAQTAAGAIGSTALRDELEHRNTELADLVDLGEAVSSAGGLTELAHAVGPRVVATMCADGCQIFSLRGGKLHCVLTYEDGAFDEEYVDKPLDLDLFPGTRDAISRREPLVIESPDDPRLSDYERGLFHESGSQSEICVPFALDGRVVGLLDVYDHRRRDYAEHRGFLMRVGQMIAGAFENALLMEQLEESNQTLRLLVESGIEFSASLDLDDVLQSVARRLCSAAGAPSCDIFTLHGDSMRCACSVERGTPDTKYVGADYRLAALDLARLAIETRRPVAAADLSTDPRVSAFERREDLGWGHRAVLALPLISRGDVIGIAGIYDDHPRDFERLDMLHGLAQVAATALANATLFDRLDRGA